mmetsp:Transcript_13639/g.34268  ORF Transcript_13639/g.34268 Transcript_13639/m.34268 type:complete len:231 (+) Transcript_13639:313-1005(+)
MEAGTQTGGPTTPPSMAVDTPTPTPRTTLLPEPELLPSPARSPTTLFRDPTPSPPPAPSPRDGTESLTPTVIPTLMPAPTTTTERPTPAPRPSLMPSTTTTMAPTPTPTPNSTLVLTVRTSLVPWELRSLSPSPRITNTMTGGAMAVLVEPSLAPNPRPGRDSRTGTAHRCSSSSTTSSTRGPWASSTSPLISSSQLDTRSHTSDKSEIFRLPMSTALACLHVCMFHSWL